MGIRDRLEKFIRSEVESEGQVSTNESNEVVDVNLSEDTNITKDVALKIAALNEGVNMISDTFASLPIHLYKRESDGSKTKIVDSRDNILNLESSLNCTSFNMKKTLMVDYLLTGNAYLDIDRDGSGDLLSLINIPGNDITVLNSDVSNKKNSRYKFMYWNETKDSYEVFNMVRSPKNDDVTGMGVLKEGAIILQEAKSLDEYSKNIVSNGFNARGVIETEKVMSKPSRESLKQLLRNFFSGSKSAGKVLILDDGLKFKSLSLSPADMDLLQQKNFSIEDIARLLKIPGYLLGSTSSSMVYSNVEQTQLNYLQMTIDPLLRIFENTLNKYLLTEDEKANGFYFETDTTKMLRTTPEQELKMYSEGIKNSIFTINEVRKKLNMVALDGLDRPLIMSGMCIINDDGSITGPTPGGPNVTDEVSTAPGGPADDDIKVET